MDRVVLTAKEGMILTDGRIYAKRLELGEWDKAENYREIPVIEYEKMVGGVGNDD